MITLYDGMITQEIVIMLFQFAGVIKTLQLCVQIR
uniref:Uncharacterized protein n=1 Tax=Myoviridae sp. ct9MV2 TaxID=2826625 RepID=A0A8S5NCV5_9CAUD|nr:MAG TPA: hypothetical protein [Myoviridae sp. ct9MV2]